MALCWTLDKLGPMTRSAADAETVLRIIAGADPADPTARERPFPLPRRRPRIAVLAKATRKTMPAGKANFTRSLRVLGEFCDLVEGVELPDLPYAPAVEIIVKAEGAAAFRGLIESGRARELRAVDDRTGGYAGYATRAVDYIDALRNRTLMLAALEQSFEPYDAIVAPTLPTVAYPVDRPFDEAYPKYPGALSLIPAGNLIGAPAIGLPNGFAGNGLPTGLSLLGLPWCEVKLTRIAREYQRRSDFHRARPKL